MLWVLSVKISHYLLELGFGVSAILLDTMSQGCKFMMVMLKECEVDNVCSCRLSAALSSPVWFRMTSHNRRLANGFNFLRMLSFLKRHCFES